MCFKQSGTTMSQGVCSALASFCLIGARITYPKSHSSHQRLSNQQRSTSTYKLTRKRHFACLLQLLRIVTNAPTKMTTKASSSSPRPRLV
ncbi:hypothetical protein BKA80DRAFT_274329, partial [Phyllosticta citrichinensis]